MALLQQQRVLFLISTCQTNLAPVVVEAEGVCLGGVPASPVYSPPFLMILYYECRVIIRVVLTDLSVVASL